MKKKLQKRACMVSGAIFILLIAFLVFMPELALAAEKDVPWYKKFSIGIPFYDLPKASDIGWMVVMAILQWLFNAMGILLALAMSMLDLVTSPILFDEVFFSAPALAGLTTAWGLVRDFVNMFFILILVFLAIATILRINKYSDKKMLLYVVIAAMLVNFSMPITLIVIDASNLAMAFFMDNINAQNGSYSSALLHNLRFEEVLDSNMSNSPQMATAMLVGIIFKFIMGFMLMVLAVTLIVRLVAFWVLIILSPLAFFSMALPGTMLSKLKDGWFSKLIGWAFYGPIMLFFLWIALVMVSASTDAINNAPSIDQIQMKSASSISEEGKSKSFFVGAFGIVIPFATAIYMLFYGYSLSRSFANSMGSSAAGILDKGLRKMGTGAKVAAAGATLGGSVWAANQYKSAKQAASEQDLRLTTPVGKIPLNKKARENQAKERKGKYDKFFGENSENSAEYRSAEVNEKLKSWDDKGVPDNDQLKEMVNGTGSSDAEKRAAALRLAKNGRLDSETYRNSMKHFESDPKLATRFKDQAKKSNRSAMIDYDVEQEVNRREVAGETMTTEKKEEIKVNKYREEVKKMKLSQIADQDNSFHESEQFHTAMKERRARGGLTEQQIKDLDLRGEVREIWDGKRNFETTGGERLSDQEAEESMRDMNS